jgi:hypothetical protein
MDPSASYNHSAFHFDDPRQERIHRELSELLGPGSASLYRDACILMSFDPKLPSTVHLVGHLFRELEGQLRNVLVDPVQLAKQKEAKAQPASKAMTGLPRDAGVPPDDAVVKARQGVVEPLARMTHREQIENILEGLNIPQDDEVAKLWIRRATGEMKPHALAHHRTLGRTLAFDEQIATIFEEWETVFDSILNNFRLRYANYHGRLDALLENEFPSKKGSSVICVVDG